MDFQRLNNLAKGYTCVPISELNLDKQYAIENIRKVKTTEYGEKVVVDLEGDIFSYLPRRISLDLLANDEKGLKQFQEQLEFSNILFRRLPGRGRWNPVEFITVFPDDPTNLINVADPVNATNPANVAGPTNAANPSNTIKPANAADVDKK